MENKVNMQVCAYNKLACKNCKWSVITGVVNKKCVKYENKPNSVYYEGKECPEFVKRKI